VLALVALSLASAAAAAVPGPSRAAGRQVSAAGRGLIGVLVEPSRLGSSSGMEPIYHFILSAKKSVDLTMYELVDPTMVDDLIADRKRGVKVRVILDKNLESARNTPAFDALRRGGVAVVWAWTGYDATHEKCWVVDGNEALVASMNATDEYYTTTRDFGIWDTNPADVAAIDGVFNADFAHKAIRPSRGADLVWSPGSMSQLLAVINGAKRTLSIENEEMSSSPIVSAIVGAARRGVRVQVTMTADSSYDAELTSIVRAGGHVHLYAYGYSDLYIHAKVAIADAGLSSQRIYSGSINFSTASMDYNRELGIITTSPTIVKDINAVVSRDYSDCSHSTDCTNYT